MQSNKIELKMYSVSENESFARMAVASYALRLNPTIDELSDIKTAVSEAVTNSIVHGYRDSIGIISIECEIEERTLKICISDEGVGIPDIGLAMTPLYTTLEKEERSGMGFSFMEIFMDSLVVESDINKGTRVYMTKTIM